MVVKTFRGLLADGGQDQIRLQTIKGKVGYRIVKFQLMQTTFANTEVLIRIWKEAPTSAEASSVIDFTNSSMLAAGMVSGYAASESYPEDIIIIFDKEIFNQDIFMTNLAVGNAQPINYYLELEVIPLDDVAAEYTTVKDLRTRGF